MQNPKLDAFLQELYKHVQHNSVIKLVLSQYTGNTLDLERVIVRSIMIKQVPSLSFTYRYATRDITKNHPNEEGFILIKDQLNTDFKAAFLNGEQIEVQYNISKKGHATLSQKSTTTLTAPTQHNRNKQHSVDTHRPYLQSLNITDSQHRVIPTMTHKWKQINKFIEVVEQAISQCTLNTQSNINIVDFGSGKGYLTFALYDYLHQQKTLQMTGVELRQPLVDLCNDTAKSMAYFPQLQFVCGDVKTHAPANTDIMIALHACDIATDHAIHYGIAAQAKIIVCSPCCHKEIRPQMHSPEALKPLLQYGVHLGQEAEMLTDTLRALFLEAHGYTTKIFEFISAEHTNKNKMILAIKNKNSNDKNQWLDKINTLKTFYGIQTITLETLLNSINTKGH